MADLLIAGLGNAGLPLVDYIARMGGVRSVILVDPDNFTTENLSGQPISPGSVNAAKVHVAAERIREINRSIAIEARKSPLQELPRGLFRHRVVISALDTRFARVNLSQICFSVGCDFVLDIGVRPEQRIARVSAVFPSVRGAACPCCCWSQRDWDAIHAEFSCDGVIKSRPTRSPAYLGAVAAAMAAGLLERYLAGTLERVPEVRQHMFSLRLHKSWVTTVRRDPDCRSSHDTWEITGSIADDLVLRHWPVCVPGFFFVRNLRCECGAERRLLFVAARLRAEQMLCNVCGQGGMKFGALDLADEIDLSALEGFGPEMKALAPAEIGLVEGDILRFGGRFFEVTSGALFHG